MSYKGFSVGDRVIAIKSYDNNSRIVNQIGIIKSIIPTSYQPFGICFDKHIGGHNLFRSGVNCTNGHGWYVEYDVIKLYNINKRI